MYLSPLRIKLRVIKNFVEGMGRGRSAFKYIKMKFAEGSYAKIKESAFVLIHDKRCNAVLLAKQNMLWDFFKSLVIKSRQSTSDFFFTKKATTQRKI